MCPVDSGRRSESVHRRVQDCRIERDVRQLRSDAGGDCRLGRDDAVRAAGGHGAVSRDGLSETGRVRHGRVSGGAETAGRRARGGPRPGTPPRCDRRQGVGRRCGASSERQAWLGTSRTVRWRWVARACASSDSVLARVSPSMASRGPGSRNAEWSVRVTVSASASCSTRPASTRLGRSLAGARPPRRGAPRPSRPYVACACRPRARSPVPRGGLGRTPRGCGGRVGGIRPVTAERRKYLCGHPGFTRALVRVFNHTYETSRGRIRSEPNCLPRPDPARTCEGLGRARRRPRGVVARTTAPVIDC